MKTVEIIIFYNTLVILDIKVTKNNRVAFLLIYLKNHMIFNKMDYNLKIAK
jgi:hypothetical protein